MIVRIGLGRRLGLSTRLGLVVGLLVISCSDDEKTLCTLDALPSVWVSVVDADGVAVSDAELTYSLDGGPLLACGNSLRNLYSCGIETAGQFAITARSGMRVGTATVKVGQDVCHVITEAVVIQIE